MGPDERIERHRTDDGYIMALVRVVGEVHVTRRDDLRGCWEVAGDIYPNLDAASEAARDYLSSGDTPTT